MAVDNNKKEQRQQKKADRQQTKIDKFKAGMKDRPSIDIGPLGAERKAEIDKRISGSVKEDVRKGLEQFQSRYKAPDIKTPEKPTYEPTIKDVRRAKRAKVADILTAFGKGLKGQKVDPTMYRDRLDAGRDEKYQQYKDITQKGQQRLDQWSDKYTQDQLDYLESLQKKETSPLKQEKIQVEIENIRSQSDANKALAESRRRKPATKSSSGRSLYPSYEYKTGEGQTIKIPMKGDEADAYKLNNAILRANKLKEERDRIQKEMDTEIYQAESTGMLGLGKSKSEAQQEIRDRYQPLLNKAISDVKNAETEITSVFEGKEMGATVNQQDTEIEDTEGAEETDFMSIVNQYK